MYLFCDERWDILWNIAWAWGKSKGRARGISQPRAQAKFHSISRLEFGNICSFLSACLSFKRCEPRGITISTCILSFWQDFFVKGAKSTTVLSLLLNDSLPAKSTLTNPPNVIRASKFSRTQIFNCGPVGPWGPTIYHTRYWKFPGVPPPRGSLTAASE